MKLLHERDGVLPVGGIPGNLHVGLALDERTKSEPHHDVIVDYDYANHRQSPTLPCAAERTCAGLCRVNVVPGCGLPLNGAWTVSVVPFPGSEEISSSAWMCLARSFMPVIPNRPASTDATFSTSNPLPL